jgi:hypothetical protein
MTFYEAHQKTGRVLNICVVSHDAYYKLTKWSSEGPQLYHSSDRPHILSDAGVWSTAIHNSRRKIVAKSEGSS